MNTRNEHELFSFCLLSKCTSFKGKRSARLSRYFNREKIHQKSSLLLHIPKDPASQALVVFTPYSLSFVFFHVQGTLAQLVTGCPFYAEHVKTAVEARLWLTTALARKHDPRNS